VFVGATSKGDSRLLSRRRKEKKIITQEPDPMVANGRCNST